jgi:DNA repair ATPase RecN
LAIKNLLSKIRFKCPNKGCTVSFDYSKIEKHNKECPFKQIQCPNENCHKILLRKDLDNHINNECEYLLIKCKYCNYEFIKKEIEHHENTCKLINNGRDSLNCDTNKIGFDEHLKRLSKNLNEIIKSNQKLVENNEKINEKKQNNVDKYPCRISIRKSIVPGLEEDEFLDIIQKEIETKIKNYYTDFHDNFSKVIKEIDDIKEELKHYIII